jgi:stalled ribosome rescue protein Dom34
MSTATPHFHALVWIDHSQAKVFHLNATESDLKNIPSTHPHQHLHHHANSRDDGHVAVDKEFLKKVSQALGDAGAILITGPSTAKTELVSYINHSHPDIAKRISGIETLDHPSDGELVAHARKFFKADDRMHG